AFRQRLSAMFFFFFFFKNLPTVRQKRKFLWDLDGAYENERQCVLDISLGKFHHMHMLETSLRCKVLVGNTLRKIQEEIHLEGILTKEVNPCTVTSPCAATETCPRVDNSSPPLSVTVGAENTGDAWSDLDSVFDGPQPQTQVPLGSTGDSGTEENHIMETGILGSFEIIPSCYLSDAAFDDPFGDIDTSHFQPEMAYLDSQPFSAAATDAALNSTTVSSSLSLSFHSQNSRDLSELDHIMDILVGS
uniref:SERTA domain containing 3 n=1 Tax=Scleropages formosus TaxID=113540 RepID=A0A8C9WG96_SCLFO